MATLIKNILVLPVVLLLAWGSVAQADEADDRWSTSYALEANGQYEKAAAVIVPMLDQGPHSEFALMRYGWLNYLQGNYNDAIRSYKRALERNQRSFDARLGITLPLLAQQRWKEASRFLSQILDVSPYNYISHVRLMVCEEGLRKWETLEKHAGEIAAIYPSDETVLVYLARAYAWQAKNSKAKTAYQRVLVRNPENLEAIRYLKR